MSPLIWTRLGLLVLAIGSTAGHASAQSADSDADPLRRYEWVGPVSPLERTVGGLLRESRRADEARRARIVDDIVASGSKGIDGLLEILVQERVPKSTSEDAPQSLSAPQREIVLNAIARLPAAAVRDRLSARAAEKPDPAANVASMRILGVIGDDADLRTLSGLALRDEEGVMLDSSRRALCEAFAAILRRAPRAYDHLDGLRADLDLAAQLELLKAMAEVGDGRALAHFFECARSQPETRNTAVALVPRLSPARDVQVSLEFAAWLRGQIPLTRVDWTRAVYNALGALDEGAAIPDLFDSLSAQELPLRESAQAALQRISGLSFGPDRTRWDAWYSTESSWYERGRLAQDVGSRQTPSQELIASLRAYSHHRLFKSDLAADLLPLLENPDPAVRALVCETLEHVGSQRAVRDLIPLLDDPAQSVATAARHALEVLVGGNVPTESSAARESILHES